MTMLVCDEVLRFLYAISLRWPGLLTRATVLGIVGAAVLVAWQRLKKPVQTGILPIGSRRIRRARA
jgi:hypothetical protein